MSTGDVKITEGKHTNRFILKPLRQAVADGFMVQLVIWLEGGLVVSSLPSSGRSLPNPVRTQIIKLVNAHSRKPDVVRRRFDSTGSFLTGVRPEDDNRHRLNPKKRTKF